MNDEPIGPTIETTYTVRMKADVTARLEGSFQVARSAVAAYFDIDESEVTNQLVIDYSQEAEDDQGEPVWDESIMDLEEVDDWRRVRAEVAHTRRIRRTPAGWAPLIPDDHGHSTRMHRDACARGVCYLDDRIDPGEDAPSSGHDLRAPVVTTRPNQG